jgi:hypothetical protein
MVGSPAAVEVLTGDLAPNAGAGLDGHGRHRKHRIDGIGLLTTC